MRLIKLLAYSLLGYVLYELYLGMTEGAQAQSSGSPPAQTRGNRSDSKRRTAGATTGAPQARNVSVEDAGGGQAKRNVGRGVVH
jgi:hypothetical protein